MTIHICDALELGTCEIRLYFAVCIIVLYVYFVCVFRKAIPTGMISGAAAQFLASPTDLVKVQMQMEGKRQLEGLKPR